MGKLQIVLAACLAATGATPAMAGLLGSVETEDCVVTDVGIDCEQQTTATFAVSFGLTAIADLVFLDSDNPPQVASQAKVELQKSQPIVTYPLIYYHTVDYAPRQGPGELLFAGYEIGEPVTDYQVLGKLTTGTASNLKVSEFALSPEDPVYASAADPGYQGDQPLRAELLGDFAAYKGLPELDNFILYIPASPATHPFVEDWQNNMLLVPREEVSYAGTECNKVGYVPKTRWGRKRGRCLKNQLVDKQQADLERLSRNPNLETTYLVSGKRAFKRTEWFTSKAGTKLLSYEPPEIQNTQVAITTDRADGLRGTIAESNGVIVEADTLGNPFEAQSRNGTLRVRVRNGGGLRADYIVAVTGCGDDIVEAIPAQARTVTPGEETVLYFDLYTTGASGVAGIACTVTLKSPRGRIYDQVEAVFDTADSPAAR